MVNPTGYQLLTNEQRADMDTLVELCTHQDTMLFAPLDAIHLSEYESFCDRLEREYEIENILQ